MLHVIKNAPLFYMLLCSINPKLCFILFLPTEVLGCGYMKSDHDMLSNFKIQNIAF